MAIDPERYQDQLLTTEAQLDVLREYNDRCWQGEIGESQFATIEVDNQPQKLEDARVVHAEFGDTIGTIDHWRRAYMATRWGEVHWNALPDTKILGDYLRLHEDGHGHIATYQPGLHIVRMDLTKDHGSFDSRDEHGSIQQTRSMDGIRDKVRETPMLLAQSEVLSLVGLHRAFRLDSGYARDNNPYLSGYEMRAHERRSDYNLVPAFSGGHEEDTSGLRVLPVRSVPYDAIPLVYPQQ